MKKIIPIFILFMLTFLSCERCIEHIAALETDRLSYNVIYELRTPNDFYSLSGFEIGLITNDSASGTIIELPIKSDDKYVYYSGSELIFKDIRRYLIIKQPQKPVVVFELNIPNIAEPRDWTDWKVPDFFDASDSTSWHLMNDQQNKLKKSYIYDNCIELRYKVKKYTYSISGAL